MRGEVEVAIVEGVNYTDLGGLGCIPSIMVCKLKVVRISIIEVSQIKMYGISEGGRGKSLA